MESKRGKLFVITGPSGVGKGTILKEFFKKNENAKYSISSTTRKPREDEVNGEHYFFVSENEFLSAVERGDFLEYAQYGGNYYGTNKNLVEGMLSVGYDVILEIELQGVLQVMEKCPDVVSIFILPPSLVELENRLRGRKTEDESVILRRLNIARKEIAAAPKFRYNVTNDTVEAALARLQEIYDREAAQ